MRHSPLITEGKGRDSASDQLVNGSKRGMDEGETHLIATDSRHRGQEAPGGSDTEGGHRISVKAGGSIAKKHVGMVEGNSHSHEQLTDFDTRLTFNAGDTGLRTGVPVGMAVLRDPADLPSLGDEAVLETRREEIDGAIEFPLGVTDFERGGFRGQLVRSEHTTGHLHLGWNHRAGDEVR